MRKKLWRKYGLQGRSSISYTYFKAEAVNGRRFSKIIVLQCSFFALVKAWIMPVTDVILVVYLSVLPACYFTKG